MRLFFILFLFTFLLSCEPHPLQLELESRYPRCQVISIKDLDKNQVEASLQCGPVVKTVTYRKH